MGEDDGFPVLPGRRERALSSRHARTRGRQRALPEARQPVTTHVGGGGAAPGSGDGSSDLTARQPRETLLNRELSWLDFNARVLALAEDPTLPLLERARFLAICSRNLDEFFQVRVGGLKQQIALGVAQRSADGMSAAEQLRAINGRVRDIVERQSRCFRLDVCSELDVAGVQLTPWEQLRESDRVHLSDVFATAIFPVLTPLAVDPAHPFPYISNLSLNLAVVVGDLDDGTRHVARVKVPPLLQRFVPLPDGRRFVALEQVIAAHLALLFPQMDIVSHYPFRLTRNADFDLQGEEAEDLLEAVQTVLAQRRRSPLAVRLEIDTAMPDDVRNLLVRELELDDDDVYRVEGPLDLSGLWDLHELDRPDLKYEPWRPVTPAPLASAPGEPPPSVFRVLRTRDVMVHHPYESFDTTVESFIEQASRDPRVLAIKQTLYRTSGPASPIIRSLIGAAAAGKQVVALIELTARFDEQANITWAQLLEDAGVHVVYGIVGLKTHAKLTLVVRQEDSGVRRYMHVGTGNYHSETARIYEDIGLLTSDSDLGEDLSDLFNLLTGYSRQREYRRLLVAPLTLRGALLDLIAAESRPGGRITIKVNSLVDTAMIEALYAASRAGADVDLIVRGICCLRPGVAGLSEGIHVRSIVGRYLEHSRVYRFGSGADARYYAGSADLMPRNMERRLEVLFPILAAALRLRLDQVLDLELADNTRAWELRDDSWTRVKAGDDVPVDAQQRLQELARLRSHATP